VTTSLGVTFNLLSARRRNRRAALTISPP